MDPRPKRIFAIKGLRLNWWAVVNPKGKVLQSTIVPDRSQAIRFFLARYNRTRDGKRRKFCSNWKGFYRIGYRTRNLGPVPTVF